MSFNPAMLLSSTAPAALSMLDTEAVTITRANPISGSPGQYGTPIDVYSGPADVQIGSGSIYYNPGGAVEQADGTLIIDPSTSGGTLPALKVNDIVTLTDGATYTIVQVATWEFAPIHVEAMLKRGPAGAYGPTR